MATAGSGAVFFLGTRAHYQVLQQPESCFDVENGNSTETIYQNPSVQWTDKVDNYNNQQYCGDETVTEDKDVGVKRRNKRRSSETALCEDMKPAALNNIESSTPKAKSRRSLLAYLTSIRRKKKTLEHSHYLTHLQSITSCTYRESCRCLECQSRYFECDEEEEDYSSEDDSEYLHYLSLAMQPQPPPDDDDGDEDEDDEVFVDEKPPEDNTSTDMLLEPQKMSVSTEGDADPDNLNLEVAAGTPVLLNYLLTHPVTCAIQ